MSALRRIRSQKALPDGTLVFQGMCERYHVRLDKDEEIKKIIEEAEKEEQKKPDTIVVEDEWVIIGNLKIPKN